MKITQLANTRPLLSLTGLIGGGGSTGPVGQVPTSNGSNGVSWGSNVATITADGSNLIRGPYVNIASGSNVLFTFDGLVGSTPSNTLRIHSTSGGGGGGGSGLTQAYVGYNTVGASNEAPANKKVLATKITTTAAVELLTIECHLKTNTGTPGVLMWGVWEDNAGVPRALLFADGAETASFLFSPGSDRYRWAAFPCGMHLAASTSYWIGLMFDGTFQVHYDTSGSDHTITSGGWWIPDWDFYSDSDTTKRYSIRGSTIK